MGSAQGGDGKTRAEPHPPPATPERCQLEVYIYQGLPRQPACAGVHAKSLQSRLTLCHPMDCSFHVLLQGQVSLPPHGTTDSEGEGQDSARTLKTMLPVYIYYGILLSLKKNERMPLAAAWMGLEIIILK